MLQTLRGAMIGALRRRNLWQHSPRYLGIIGHNRWTTPAPTDALILDDAVGELVTECYVYIFVQRLTRLLAQLAVRPNIDGLVFLNIRHFLHEKQRTCDPLGYRTLTVLRTSLRSLHEVGRLEVLEGPVTINSMTVLGFTSGGAAASSQQASSQPASAQRASSQRLATLTATWSDHFAQPIAQARAGALQTVAHQLADRIMMLRQDAVSAFRVGDLIRPFQVGVRERWATRAIEPHATAFEHLNGIAVPVAITPPSQALEQRAAFRDLVGTIADRIDQLEIKPKTRRYLQILWAYLSAFAEDRPDLNHNEKHRSDKKNATEALPSHRQLGTMLGIPRDRLPELFATLRHLIERQAGRERPASSTTVPLVESA